MSFETTVELEGSRAVVVKRAPGQSAHLLRAEAERLRKVSHPGVVQVVRSAPCEAGWELRTTHAGRALSTLDHVPVAQLAAIAVGVCATLADLHELGLVHGRLRASHILIGDGGRPLLCGFGPGRDGARAEDDVAALGTILSEVMGSTAEEEPAPERSWRRRRGSAQRLRRALLALADQARAEPRTRRPTARRLAAAIADAVPELDAFAPESVTDAPASGTTDGILCGDSGVETPGPAVDLDESRLGPGGDPVDRLRPPPDPPPPARRPLRLAPVLALAGLVLLVGGGWRILGEDSDRPDSSDPPANPAVDVRVGAVLAGSEVSADGRRYRVGQEGDQVLVDDWNCDGTATPALLRPSTGEVFVFVRWAGTSALSVGPTVQVAGAEALVSELGSDGCPVLAVRAASGDLVPVAGGER